MPAPRSACPGAGARGGLPLPAALNARMRQLTGQDFGDVRIHVSTEVARLGAVALCRGADLHFAPGAYDPGSAAGLRLLGHELGHVVQQRDGRLPHPRGAGLRLLRDPALEADADAFAAAFAGGGTWPGQGRRGAGQAPAPYRPDLVQATLKVREPGGVRELTSAEEAHAAVLANVQGSFQSFFQHVKRDILPILHEWITAQPGDDPRAWAQRKAAGQRRHILEFTDYTNLARAVMGEFLSAGALAEVETPLAQRTVQSAYIGAHLGALLEKLSLKVAADRSGALARLKNLNAPPDGPYQPLYRKTGANIPKVLANPDAYYFEDKIVTLHDVMDCLKQHGLVEVPPDKSAGSYFTINDLGYPQVMRRPIQGTADFRFNDKDADTGGYRHFTLKEDTGYIMAARVEGMPIWAGPSFTTGRLMQMVTWAGGSAEEHEALAWGIFAFWNQCYPESSTWTHRFHAVLDMAHNYGVPYQPFCYPKAPPPNAVDWNPPY